MNVTNLFDEDFFNRFFDEFTRPVRSAAKGHGFANMPQIIPQVQTPSMRTDIKEAEGGYEFAIELPGFDKEDITAELKDGYLTIIAKKETVCEDTEDNTNDCKYIRKERCSGSCKRSFYIGEEVTQDQIKAKFNSGILELFVPKIEKEVEPEERNFINIEG